MRRIVTPGTALPGLFALLALLAPLALLAMSACNESHSSTDAGDAGDSGGRDSSAMDTGTDTAPPPGDYSSCEYVGDCVLASTTCCGVCGRPSATDFEGVNRDRADDYRDEVACPEPEPCPGCPSQLNPNLVPTCTGGPTAGTCEVLDIETPTYAACATAADCVVRTPECCECGADVTPYALVALSGEGLGAYLSAVCDPRADCAACAPVYPGEVSAICVAGLCQLEIGDP